MSDAGPYPWDDEIANFHNSFGNSASKIQFVERTSFIIFMIFIVIIGVFSFGLSRYDGKIEGADIDRR